METILYPSITVLCKAIKDRETHSNILKEALETPKPSEKNYETQRARIEDLKTQIQALYDQLHTKDDQITQLNEVTQKQAVHIQA